MDVSRAPRERATGRVLARAQWLQAEIFASLRRSPARATSIDRIALDVSRWHQRGQTDGQTDAQVRQLSADEQTQ